jgi:hypothetical protein
VGWEDSEVGKHGLGVFVEPGGGLAAVVRNQGQVGDVRDAGPVQGFQTVCVTWGPDGTFLYRNGKPAGTRKGIDGLSSDPAITSLVLGGPGSGKGRKFRGDLAEVRVYNRPLGDAERRQVIAELEDNWFKRAAPRPADPLADLYDELLSPRGPFWVPIAQRSKLLPPGFPARLAALRRELEILRKKPPLEIPQMVSVQEGGPKDTRFEGIKDSPIFLRGSLRKPGKIVPRGFPRILTGGRVERITRGSGRLQLADWLTRPDHPLTARVMVNRIWQHHFGQGLVRTPNNFGQRGERPDNPELLDYLAARFVESGWSVKAMHRLILLSSAYQQASRADAAALAADPDNRLLARMNRQRLDAEAIRDSLLVVAGRLDASAGGPAFTDLAVPRRTLYLMAARTGANTSDFGRLFDRADPGSIVDQRGQSVVAPQALFFLNDPVVQAWARELAARVAREAPADSEARLRRLYALTLGRPPTRAEIDLGVQLLGVGGADAWESYCHMLVCTNEFIYLD